MTRVHEEPELDFEDAVRFVMKRTGKTRKQAKTALVEAIRKGKLPIYHIDEQGKRVRIPQEEFEGPVRDNEGDWYGLE